MLLSELVMLDRRFDDTDQVRNTVDALLSRLANLPGTRAAVERTQFFAGFGGTDPRISVEGLPAVQEGASLASISRFRPISSTCRARR